MAHRSQSSSRHNQNNGRRQFRHVKKDHDEVHLITGAYESVVADSERKNRTYAVLIGVRILSLFVVLMTDGWVQIAVFVGGMLAPWIGVQIANTIRQVDSRSMKTIPPQQAALEASSHDADAPEDDTVIVGDFVVQDPQAASTPSAESAANGSKLSEDEKHNDDTRL